MFSVRCSPLKLAPVALALAAAALAACTPDLDDKLACVNSTQCPTGYFCGTDGKCQAGATSPEITVITPTAGITFSGLIVLQMSVIDPAGITSVTVGLAGPSSDAGSPVAATGGTNSIYSATLDTRAMGISSSGAFTATIFATNANGKSSSLPVPLQLDDAPPVLSNVSISPLTITAGEATTISFSSGETLASLPVVTLTPPDNSTARHAAYVAVTNNSYSYQFIPLAADPVGVWKVQVTADDSFGNSSSSSGNDSFTVIATSGQSVALSGVRGDGVTGAQAFYLKSGATLAVTAVFGTPLAAAPSAFLCPVGTAAPCLSSSAGSSTLTGSASGSNYLFNLPAVSHTLSPNNEGAHVLTVAGTSAAGAAISGSATLVFDFTAPVFTVQDIGNGESENTDSEGRRMVSLARDGFINYAALIDEPLSGLTGITAVTDNGIPVLQVANPTTLALLPQFQLELGGTLVSTPPVANSFSGHSLEVTLCDLAGNCASATSSAFVEVDSTTPALAFDFPLSGETFPLPDGAQQSAYRAGQNLVFGMRLDRELGNNGAGNAGFNPFGGSSGYAYSGAADNYTSSSVTAPFGYIYNTTVDPISDGAYPVILTELRDGYGNNLIPASGTLSSSPFVINIKNSVPVLTASDGSGGTPVVQFSQLGPNAGSSSQPSWYFVSQSGGVPDTLTSGVAVCVDPPVVNGAINCTSSTTSSAGGLTATVLPAGTGGTVDTQIGRISFTTTSSPVTGNHTIVITYTDPAGNVGSLQNNLFVNGTGPTLVSWSLDTTSAPPSGIANLTVAFADPSTLSPPTGLVDSTLQSLGLVTIGAATSLGGGAYKISFTMPPVCDGTSGHLNGAAFNIGVSVTDSLGLTYISDPNSPPSLATLRCIPAPSVTASSFDKTVLPPHGVATLTVTTDEELGVLGGNVGAVVAGGLSVGISVSGPNAATPRTTLIQFTMPSACTGASNTPSDGVPFGVSVTLYDGNSANRLTTVPVGNLTCDNTPKLLAYAFDNTVVASGATATAKLEVNEPLANVTGSSTPAYTSGQLTITPAAGGTFVATGNPLQYQITFKPFCSVTLPSSGFPDDVATPVSATLNDGINPSVTFSLGTIICTAASIANAHANAADLFLLKQPYSDGSIRSVVSGSPGALTGEIGSKGIALVAYDSTQTVIGIGPLIWDGGTTAASVAPFQLSSPATQVTLAFVDLANEPPVILDGGYPEELDNNGTGTSLSTTNQFKIYDVTTGDDNFYTPDFWMPSGPGDQASGNPLLYAPTVGEVLALDGDALLFGDAGTLHTLSDAGKLADLGAEPFGNPLIPIDAGTALPAPGPRSSGAALYGFAAIDGGFDGPGDLYLLGGSTTATDSAQNIWAWTAAGGWSDTKVTTGTTPQNFNAALLIDDNGNLLSIGGSNAASAGTVVNTISLLGPAAVSPFYTWTNGGSLGIPASDGGVTSPGTPIAITSWGSGDAYYSFNTSSTEGILESYWLAMTLIATGATGTTSCLIVTSASPNGSSPSGPAVYSCSTPSNGWVSMVQPAFAVTDFNESSVTGFTNYGAFAFGEPSTGSAADTLYGATFNYNIFGGTLSTTWTPITVASGSLPPVRHGGSLFYIPDTNRIGLYGGTSNSGALLVDAWEFDLATQTWLQTTQPANSIVPTGRSGAATTNDGEGTLYQFGGTPAGGSAQSDGWDFDRATRNRIVAKIPYNLTNPTTAVLSDLEISLAANATAVFRGQSNIEQRASLISPDLQFTQAPVGELYIWNGSAWQYETEILTGQENIYIQLATGGAAALPPAAWADGNFYVMLATFGDDETSTPLSLSLDQMTFELHFK